MNQEHFQYCEKDLDILARNVVDKVKNSKPFCLYLEGPLGAGKTTLVGHLLRSLGLPKNSAVRSPTFTYLIEYNIGDKCFAHMDLYRGHFDLNMDELGMTGNKNYDGYFIEWPQCVGMLEEAIPATHSIKIAYQNNSFESRNYTFSKV